MSRARGMTLVEMMVGIAITGFLILVSMSLFTMSIGSFRKTDVRTDMSQKLSLSLRKITQNLRSAVSVTISADTKTVTFQLPLLGGTVDPVTGELEYVNPVQADGINRTFYVSGPNLYYNDGSGSGAKVISKNISATDPDPQSAYYNAAYPVFSFSSVGSTRGLTVMLISRRAAAHTTESVRMSSSVYFRNLP